MKNYLSDLYPGPGLPIGFSLANRKDPDGESEELYADLNNTFFHPEANKELGIQSVVEELYYGSPVLTINNGEFLLSSDYIGPSVYWAQKSGMIDSEIVEFLKVSRTLGGHILFPKGVSKEVVNYEPYYDYRNGKWKKRAITMNLAKASEKGYYDRFDKTLYAIKQLFKGKTISNEKVKKAYDNYSDWFAHFEKENDAFIFFVYFFKLESFVNDEYEIYDLTSYDKGKNIYKETISNDDSVIPSEVEGYRKYVQGSLNAISLRNKNLGL